MNNGIEFSDIKKALLVTEALMMGLEVETEDYTYVLGEKSEIYITAIEEKSGDKRYMRVWANYLLFAPKLIAEKMSDEQITMLAANIALNKMNRKDRG